MIYKTFYILFLFLLKDNLYASDKKIIKIAYYENFAPYSFKENNITKGIFIDISNLVLGKMMGYEVIQESFPWERAQDLVKKGIFDSHHTTRTKERDVFLDFQTEATIYSKVALVYSKNNPKKKEIDKINSKEKLKNYDLLGYLGDGWSKEQFKNDNYLNFRIISNVLNVLQMINTERADIYVSSNDFVSNYMATKNKFDNLIIRNIEFLKPSKLAFRFCVRKTYLNSDLLIKNYEKNFLIAKKEGKIDKIIKSYF